MSLLELGRGQDPVTGIQRQGMYGLPENPVAKSLVHESEMGGNISGYGFANSGAVRRMSMVGESWAANVMRAELNHFLETLDHAAFIREIAQRRTLLESDILDICQISATVPMTPYTCQACV